MTKLSKLFTICFAAALLAVSAFPSSALASEIYSSTGVYINDSVVGVYDSYDLKVNEINGASDGVIADVDETIVDGSVVGTLTKVSERLNSIEGAKGKGSKGSKTIVSADSFEMYDSVAGSVNLYSGRYNYIGN